MPMASTPDAVSLAVNPAAAIAAVTAVTSPVTFAGGAPVRVSVNGVVVSNMPEIVVSFEAKVGNVVPRSVLRAHPPFVRAGVESP